VAAVGGRGGGRVRGAVGRTAAWAPAALQRWEDQRHFDHYTQMGMDPAGGGRQLMSFSVPAPFLVHAAWRFDSRGPDGRVGSSSAGEVRAVWAFGWLQVVRDEMHWVACGRGPAEPAAEPPPATE
jgi:hypothetical protein